MIFHIPCDTAIAPVRQGIHSVTYTVRPGREIIFPTAVPDPQYELICIQPIRDDFFFSFFFFPWTYMNIHDLRLRNKSTHVRGLVILLHTTKFTCNEWRPPTACMPYKYCMLLCSHSATEALVIDPEQLRWLEVS